jgi:hypothetical protein
MPPAAPGYWAVHVAASPTICKRVDVRSGCVDFAILSSSLLHFDHLLKGRLDVRDGNRNLLSRRSMAGRLWAALTWPRPERVLQVFLVS